MTDYKKAGVDISMGDRASKIAYDFARSTFSSRKKMIGEPVNDEGSFAGMLDMGDFYIVQGDDGVGTKMEVAERIGKFDTLGYDLLAMVADDVICLGAETISISNTIDTNKVDPNIIHALMKGLANACVEQKVVIPGGEIAEVGKSVNSHIWNATAVGILEKEKIITGREIEQGDKIIALQEKGFRSNGFSLVRYILEKEFDENVYNKPSPFGKSWGEMILKPSKIYSSTLLDVLGRFGGRRKFNIKGIAHITGGGIPGNFNRILKQTGLGADLNNLFSPSAMVKEIQRIGNVSEAEAYKTWNMGNGMMIVVDKEDADAVINALSVEAKIVGSVIKDKTIIINSKGADVQKLIFEL
ncbi:MAG: phosphoribosylformylglycinamidine cyclo-ligase [Candidatus Cloacimonetes bacterium]|jgi:phosphoribosylformylglycinamidine cyclo-ligase|nr:phosphoribosylformylglycinamidine cyclo-ligase [Candidatus Cloacimonadota bacterium]